MTETEAEVVHRLAQHGGGGPLGIEVGITTGEGVEYFRRSPPAPFAVLRLAEGLVDHLHQVYRSLIRHILLNQRLYLVIVYANIYPLFFFYFTSILPLLFFYRISTI